MWQGYFKKFALVRPSFCSPPKFGRRFRDFTSYSAQEVLQGSKTSKAVTAEELEGIRQAVCAGHAPIPQKAAPSKGAKCLPAPSSVLSSSSAAGTPQSSPTKPTAPAEDVEGPPAKKSRCDIAAMRGKASSNAERKLAKVHRDLDLAIPAAEAFLTEHQESSALSGAQRQFRETIAERLEVAKLWKGMGGRKDSDTAEQKTDPASRGGDDVDMGQAETKVDDTSGAKDTEDDVKKQQRELQACIHKLRVPPARDVDDLLCSAQMSAMIDATVQVVDGDELSALQETFKKAEIAASQVAYALKKGVADAKSLITTAEREADRQASREALAQAKVQAMALKSAAKIDGFSAQASGRRLAGAWGGLSCASGHTAAMLGAGVGCSCCCGDGAESEGGPSAC